jgi:hypothetical protein
VIFDIEQYSKERKKIHTTGLNQPHISACPKPRQYRKSGYFGSFV